MVALRRDASLALALLALAAAACNAERKQQCDTLLAAMKPLDQGTPSSATDDVGRRMAKGAEEPGAATGSIVRGPLPLAEASGAEVAEMLPAGVERGGWFTRRTTTRTTTTAARQ